jgi:hypothetical protein
VQVDHFVVIPTHDRPNELAALLAAIPLRVAVLVIDNASDPSITGEAGFKGDQFDQFLGRRIRVIRDEEQPPNLSRLWNIGLDWAAKLQHPVFNEHYVTILNDDAVIEPGYFDAVEAGFQYTSAAIAFPNRPGRMLKERGHMLHREQPRCPVDFTARLTGWCFTLRGSIGLRADERLRWWCGDNDLEMQAMEHGGTVMLQDTHVGNLYADVSTVTSDALSRQTKLDMATFVKKWGFRPW